MRPTQILKANLDSGNGPYISDDIILEILEETPAKSLLRFRCVSKDWRSMIDNSNFVNIHRLQSYNRPRGIKFFMIYYESGRGNQQYSVAWAGREDKTFHLPNSSNREADLSNGDDEEGKISHLPIPSNMDDHSLSCYSVEGLMIFHSGSEDIIIWNPTIRKSVRILPPNIFISRDKLVKEGKLVVSYYHLGFDVQTKQYKLLGIYRIFSLKSVDTVQCNMQVLTLGNNSWRDITHRLEEEDKQINSIRIFQAIYSKNKIFHLIKCSNCSSLMVFFVGSEKFKFLPLWKSDIYDDDISFIVKPWSMHEIGDCAALMDSDRTVIWILRDFETRAKWEKITLLDWPRSFPCVPRIVCPMSKSDELLIMCQMEGADEDQDEDEDSTTVFCYLLDIITMTWRKGPSLSLLLEKGSKVSLDLVPETLFDPSVVSDH